MLRVLLPNLKINTQDPILFSGHLHSALLSYWLSTGYTKWHPRPGLFHNFKKNH